MRDIDKLSTAEGLCRQLAQYTFEATPDELVEQPPAGPAAASPGPPSRKAGRHASVKDMSLSSSAPHAPVLAGAWDEVAAVDAPKVIHVSNSPKLHKKRCAGGARAARAARSAAERRTLAGSGSYFPTADLVLHPQQKEEARQKGIARQRARAIGQRPGASQQQHRG